MAQPKVQASPIVAPIKGLPFVDVKTGVLTQTAQQFMQQMFSFMVGTSRLIPCTCTNVGNVYTLTQFGIGPVVRAFQDYDTFVINASALSTGAATAKVINSNGDSLGTLSVLTAAGAATGAGGQLANGGQYFLTYASAFPGLVLR